jgi:PAS domain S-box-containing protein
MNLPNSLITASDQQTDSFEVLLHRMMNRIRNSLQLSEILMTTVAEVRTFLGTDRVKIYRFDADGSGEVIAESIHDLRLPSMIGLHFPGDDIPVKARELFLKARQRSIVDIALQQIGESQLHDLNIGESNLNEDIRFRPVDPCHVAYLNAMGVQSSLVVPILHGDQLWGLLVSHHSEPRQVTEQELQVVQLISDQVSIAISQSNLFSQAIAQAQQQATINQIATLLHSMPKMQLQEALERTITALQAAGGRVYIAPQTPGQPAQLNTYGIQPQLKSNKSTGKSRKALIEEHVDWKSWLDTEKKIGEDPETWAIADLSHTSLSENSNLAQAFLSTQIRGVMIICLQYRHQVLGYLSIFRHQIDVETVWAGQFNPDDPRQLMPRRSFEAWRQLKHGQAHVWDSNEISLAQALGNHFAMAIHQYRLYQQLHTLNSELEKRVTERTTDLKQANDELLNEISERERALYERKQAQALLQRMSHQNELILNSAGEGIYGLDIEGKTTFVNPAAARMLGYKVEELTDKLMYDILSHSRADGTSYTPEENPIFTTLKEGKLQFITNDIFKRRDGSSFPVEYVSTPIQEKSVIVGAVVIFKDITERQIVERMKDEFVSVVSHELRTPLTSIRTTLGVLAGGWLADQPDKRQRMLEIACSNTDRLVRLINDILDVERIKFGKVTMVKQVCNVSDLMLQASDGMRAMSEKASIKLSVKPVLIQLWADPDRIIQTLTNLLSNAIKFSPSGTTVSLTAKQIPAVSKLRARVQKLASTTNSSHILFEVKDQGRGIPKDMLATIFDRFQQVDTSDSRHQGGTGLGLAICRNIVEHHGGSIWAESTLGKGSTIYFTLPITDDEK